MNYPVRMKKKTNPFNQRVTKLKLWETNYQVQMKWSAVAHGKQKKIYTFTFISISISNFSFFVLLSEGTISKILYYFKKTAWSSEIFLSERSQKRAPQFDIVALMGLTQGFLTVFDTSLDKTRQKQISHDVVDPQLLKSAATKESNPIVDWLQNEENGGPIWERKY